MRKIVCLLAALAVIGCAGRAPAPVQTVQMKDQVMDCNAINAEIAADTGKLKDLSSEKGAKMAQNFFAGFFGVFVPVLFFAADLQGTQDIETRAIEARDQYLSTLALQRCPAQLQLTPAQAQVTTQP